MRPEGRALGSVAALAQALDLPGPDASEVPTGTLGRYEIRGEIGRGGMGQVLRAYDPEIGREVAIKVLLDARGADRETLQRFLAEARITGQLEHPNIVPVYDAGIAEDGRIYYAMKRVAGKSLDALLETDAPGLHRRLSVFQAVCAAVSYAHHQGIIHQDLKPQNVIVGAFDEVLVLDWGLATLVRAGLRAVSEGRASAEIVGTPGFIAPERILRPTDPPSAAADQWSLGALLYTLLCRQPPYPGETSRARIEATLRGPPEDVRLRDPQAEIPNDLAEICHRALAAAPEDRFADVGALAAAVRAFQEGSERRERALQAVAAADALAPRIAERRAEAAAASAQARALLEEVRPSDPVARKVEAWAHQDRAAAALRASELDQLAWEQQLRGALQLVPDLHEAHVRLARHHRAALEAAEAVRDVGAAVRSEWLLRQHDRGHHRRWLAGTGSLTLVTDPPGAMATLRRLALVDRRLVPGEAQVLGPTPLVDLPLEPGSYVIDLDLPGHCPVRYPVFLTRAGRWDGVPPGHTAPWPVWLPPLGALAPDDRYVPAGWFLAGGDPEAADALSARRVWVDAVACRRFPVTNAQYAAWLNAQLEAGQVALAERDQPRDVQNPTHPLDGAPVYGRGADGRFGPPPDEDPSRWATLPVTRIDLESALRYAAACGSRLPDELEREKAARGVDGRHYPWGDHHDPAFSCMVSSQALPRVVGVEEFPLDESVYAVRGLAGNVREICGNRWTEAGPAVDGERLVIRAAGPEVDFVSTRGGSWSATANLARSAARFGDPPTTRHSMRGLRLVRSLGPLVHRSAPERPISSGER